MKKVLLLLIVVLCRTMVMKAETTYGIRIGSVAVTNLNANDVLGDGGSIKYNATNKILTLNNAKPAEATYGINTTEENLTIEVLGNNTISGTSNAIRANNCKKLTIIGEGTLTLASTYAINLNNTDLSIDNTNLSITCSDIGINTATSDNVVEITKSNISILPTRKSLKILPFGQFGNVTLSGCEIISPKGATYDTAKKAIVVADTIYKGNLGIKKIEETVYCRFTGNDLDVTVSNLGLDEAMNLINTKMLKSGSISIDTTTKTMYFENVRPKNDLNLYVYIGGCSINLTGENNMSYINFDITDDRKQVFIFGSGELSLLGSIDCTHAALNINSCKLTVNTFEYEFGGIFGKEDAQLSIRNAQVTVIQASEYTPIAGFDKFSLTDCEITSHEGATYDTTKKVLVDSNNKEIKTTVTIAPEEVPYFTLSYEDNAYVEYTNLSNFTSYDLSGSGTITFDAENKVMHFDNVRPDYNFQIWFFSDIDVDLIGDNQLASLSFVNSDSLAPMDVIISGDGELTLRYLGCYNTNLEIKDCKVSVSPEGSIYSLYGEDGSTLTINNSEVIVSPSSHKTIINGWDDVILENCSITSHEGATYDTSKKSLVDKDGNEITTTVTIAPVEETVYCMFYIDIDGDDDPDDEVEIRNTNLAWALDRINNDFLESGTITFDEANRIMHLNNVREKAPISLEIDNNMDIDLIGENQISFLMDSDSPKNVTISGEGELTIKYSIYWNESNLEIKDCKVTVNVEEGTYGGISVRSKAILTINNAELIVIQTEGNIPISDFGDVVLIMCEVTSHEGATYNKTKGAFVDSSGNEIKTTITIAPKILEDTGNYFMFCGTNLVTKDNCSDLSTLCPAGTLKSGSISFVPETRTIVLNNVEFEATSALSYELPGFILFSSEFSSPIFEAGIQIEVIGNNKISCGPNVAFIGFEYLFTFTGGGTLELYSEGMAGDALPVTVASLAVVDETTVEIHTGQLPSVFFVDSHSTLTVYQSNLYLYGGGVDLGGEVLPTVVNLTNTKITNCEVTCSAGAATFDATKLTFVDNAGNPITDGVFIRATPTGIENVAINKNEAIKIIKDGQVLIIRNGKQYNALGQMIK